MMLYKASASCVTNYSGRELILPVYLSVVTKLLQIFY